MRAIKFRAWTGAKMEYNVMVGFLGAFYVEGIDPKDSACMSPFNTLYGNQTPVMQYTGLKDKNLKDIYEGDIITCYAVQRETNDVIEKGEKVVVVYRDGYFYPFGYNCGWRSSVEDIEVIGNIHEHPGLLAP